MTPQDDFSHSVVLPNHPFRTSTQEAMRTLSAGVGKGSNKAQGRRSSRGSISLQSQVRNHSTASIPQMPQRERSSTFSPQKPNKDTSSIPIEGGKVEHDLTLPSQTPKTTFANRLSRLFVCGRNSNLYDQEVAIGLHALTPVKQSPIRPSMKRRSSFFSLSARYQTSPDVEFEETYITNTFPVQLTPPSVAENDEPNLLIRNNESNLHIATNNIMTSNPNENLIEPPAEIQQLDEQVPKNSALHRSTNSKARRNDTIPSSEACEYTGRKNSSAVETKASSSSLHHLPTQPPEESKLIQKDNDRQESHQKNKGKLPLPEIPNRRNSARSLRSYVSSSSLYSAASAQERAIVNTPGEVSLADDWGMSASPSRSITSTQLGQSPFMFDLLAKFPGLSSSTTQQPSGLRHMLDSESIIEGERVKTPHPPGFMPDEESDVKQELFQQNKNDIPPAQLRREGTTTTMHEAESPTSSLSNSTLETPSPPIASMNRKRLAVLNGSRLENNFAVRMASMENADTDWRDNLIGLYTEDDIIVPFPQAASHRQSVSSTTDSFHSTNLYQSVEGEKVNPPINVSYGNQRLYDTAPVPPPDVPLPPIPAQNQLLSKSQHTIRKASIGNRHRGNSDASAHSNATMKAGNRSKHSRRA